MVVVIAIVMLTGFAWAIGAGYADSSESQYSVTNETLTVDVENWTEVQNASKPYEFYDNETVYNSSGAQLEEGFDYEFDTDNGSVYWYNSSRVTDGADASISYSYVQKRQAARAIFGIFQTSAQAMSVAILLATGLAVSAFAVWVHGVLRSAGSSSRSSGGRFR